MQAIRVSLTVAEIQDSQENEFSTPKTVKGNWDVFHSTKISVWNSTPNGTVHSGCTDPTQATARFVIVLASRIQKSGTGDNDFVKWKRTFRSDRTKWPDQSLWTTIKAGPEYSGRTKPKWAVPFDVRTEITGILSWMESALGTSFPRNDFWNRLGGQAFTMIGLP